MGGRAARHPPDKDRLCSHLDDYVLQACLFVGECSFIAANVSASFQSYTFLLLRSDYQTELPLHCHIIQYDMAFMLAVFCLG